MLVDKDVEKKKDLFQGVGPQDSVAGNSEIRRAGQSLEVQSRFDSDLKSKIFRAKQQLGNSERVSILQSRSRITSSIWKP